MKILHTSDWHIGKRLYGKSRLDEQRQLLKEITEIARSESVDVALVSGDIFDTALPSAEAEQVFYESINAFSKVCLPVVIHGNHDDEHRLLAPDLLALTAGIVLAGGALPLTTVTTDSGLIVTTGENFITVKKGDEIANIAFLGYPSTGQLLDKAGDMEFNEFVLAEREKACACFKSGEINIFVSHLFVSGSEKLLTDERELGGSKLVNKSVLVDERCVYTALGHIHQPLAVSKAHNIYYSGSISQYSFDDDSEKSVIVAELTADSALVKRVPLVSGKKTVIVTAKSEDEIFRGLSENENSFVLIRYESEVPLTPSSLTEMRKKECFCAIEVVKSETRNVESERKGKTDRELFELFYEKKKGAKPSEEVVELFLNAVAGEEI